MFANEGSPVEGPPPQREGDIVHFVVRDDETPGWPQLRHRDMKILSIDPEGFADLIDTGGNEHKRVRLALSREVGTWHPVGGYGCA